MIEFSSHLNLPPARSITLGENGTLDCDLRLNTCSINSSEKGFVARFRGDPDDGFSIEISPQSINKDGREKYVRVRYVEGFGSRMFIHVPLLGGTTCDVSDGIFRCEK